MLRWSVLEPGYWSLYDRYPLVDTLTRHQLQDLVARFLDNLSIEALYVGNFTKQEAETIHAEVLSRLPAQKGVNTSLFKVCGKNSVSGIFLH